MPTYEVIELTYGMTIQIPYEVLSQRGRLFSAEE